VIIWPHVFYHNNISCDSYYHNLQIVLPTYLTLITYVPYLRHTYPMYRHTLTIYPLTYQIYLDPNNLHTLFIYLTIYTFTYPNNLSTYNLLTLPTYDIPPYLAYLFCVNQSHIWENQWKSCTSFINKRFYNLMTKTLGCFNEALGPNLSKSCIWISYVVIYVVYVDMVNIRL